MNTRYSPSTGNFYPLDIDYGANLPADVINVSIDDYHAAMARPVGYTFAFPNGELVITAPPAPALADLKAAKLAELGAAFTAAMASIRAGYPADEIQSWDEQKTEATAYAASTSAATPLLSAMAKARGMALSDLVNRVLANAAAWSTASGSLIGKRQAYEDQVSAASDAATVQAIAWTN